MRKWLLVSILLLVLLGCNLSMRQSDIAPLPPPTPTQLIPGIEKTSQFLSGFHWKITPQERPTNLREWHLTELNEEIEISSDWDTYKLEGYQLKEPDGSLGMGIRLNLKLFGETLQGTGYCYREIIFEWFTASKNHSLQVETIYPHGYGDYKKTFYLFCDDLGWVVAYEE